MAFFPSVSPLERSVVGHSISRKTVSPVELLGTHLALYNRVHCLKMAENWEHDFDVVRDQFEDQ